MHMFLDTFLPQWDYSDDKLLAKKDKIQFFVLTFYTIQNTKQLMESPYVYMRKFENVDLFICDNEEAKKRENCYFKLFFTIFICC